MGLVTIPISTTDNVIQKNIASGQWWQSSKRRRAIRRMGLVGSAAAGDMAIEISYGSEKVAVLYNGRGGAAIAPQDTDMIAQSTALVVDPGEDIHAVISDAGGTNQAFLCLDIVDLP